ESARHRCCSIEVCTKRSGPKGLESFPIELDSMAGPVRCDRKTVLNPQRLGDIPVESEPMRLEVGAVRRGPEQVNGHVVCTVRRDRQVVCLGDMRNLHEWGYSAAVRNIRLGECDSACGD